MMRSVYGPGFEQAERRHVATVAPRMARLSQVVAGQRWAEDASEQLIESYADRELLSALTETTSQLRVLKERRGEIRNAHFEAHAAELRERAARHAHDAEACEHELAECEAAIEDAASRERAVRERMLEP